MPCAGEEPITSFFKRVTPKSQPKESVASTSILSAVKRKQPAVEDSEANQWKPKKQSRLVLHNTPQNVASCVSVENQSRQTGSIHRKSLTTPRPVKNPPAGNSVTGKVQVTRTSQLPTPVTVRRPGRIPAEISLQTPPPTTYQRRKRQNPIVQNTITSIPQTVTRGMDESLLQGEESILDLLSPPSVADDSCIMKSCRISGVHHDAREPGTPEVLKACIEDPFYVFPSSQDHVPSSQTQDSEFSLTSPSFRNSAISDRTGSKISGTSWNSLSATIPEPTDDCQYIHSSQTQHMLPYHISPRRDCAADSSRARTLSLRTVLDENSDEIIPSSQSQIEIELDISKPISDCLPRTIITTNEVDHTKSLARFRQLGAVSHTDVFSKPRNVSQTAPIARTLSDDLFPSSILHLNFDELFPNEESQNSTEGDLPTHQDLYESATEDDSEEESKDVLKRAHDSRRPPTACQHQSPVPSRIFSTCVKDVDDEDLFGVLATQGSLPGTLKDFRDMFGEGGGSFLDAFPASLR